MIGWWFCCLVKPRSGKEKGKCAQRCIFKLVLGVVRALALEILSKHPQQWPELCQELNLTPSRGSGHTGKDFVAQLHQGTHTSFQMIKSALLLFKRTKTGV